MIYQKIALEYNKQFGFNILPLIDKAPIGDWIKWQRDIMTGDDINSFNWKQVNGIGAVCGINNLRCLDFDSVTDPAIVKKFLRALGLPSEYAWTVRSGSGKGYHIWFYCNDDSYLFRILGGEKSYYKLLPSGACSEDPHPGSPHPALSQRERESQKERESQRERESQKERERECDHIELRRQCCQTVLPPSLHPSGSKYQFLYVKKIPYAPYNVPVGRLADTLEKFCVLNNNPPANENKKANKKAAPVNITGLSSIAEYLAGRIDNYEDWMYTGFALASLGETGREFFLQVSSNPKYPNDNEATLNRKFDGLLKDYRGDITIASLYEIAKKYGYVKEEKYFWDITSSGKVKIYTDRMKDMLQQEGFAKIIFNRNYSYIRDRGNVIAEVDKIEIKDFLIDYIIANTRGTERAMILDHFIKNANLLCADCTLECLKTIVPDFITGTKDKEYFFFKDNYVEVTKDDVKIYSYSEMNGKVWERQKCKHPFQFSNERSDFQEFIERVCRHDLDRINAMRSAIGYLLVSYKDPSCAKAVIFIDEKLSENAHGRSGKGVVANAICEMKNCLKIDGKNFTFDKQFVFQRVNADTQLIIYDDVRKKFSFERLFSILTEGITVEVKQRTEYMMPFENSPKILITTNQTVEGTDDSSLDRQFVVEFSDYYNLHFRPVDEFGHLFFKEWNAEQWNSFFNYMIDCCRYFMANGLKSYAYVNLIKKKLIDSTASEFEEFIKAVPLETEYNKKELFEKFKEEYEDFSQVRQHTLTRWIKIYAELYNLEMTERKSGADRYITLRANTPF